MLKHKFNAVRCEYSGIKFASKKERKRYLELQLLKQAGDVLFFLFQVPIRFSGGIKYICDYQIFWSNGEVTFEDVKGVRTSMYKLKKKLVETKYPIKITEV